MLTQHASLHCSNNDDEILPVVAMREGEAEAGEVRDIIEVIEACVRFVKAARDSSRYSQNRVTFTCNFVWAILTTLSE